MMCVGQITMPYIFFGCAVQLTGSQFSNQGSNLGRQKWKHRAPVTGCQGTTQALDLKLVQFSVVSSSLQSHGLQPTRLLCPSLSFREFAQTPVHWGCDAMQPSHPLSPPSPLSSFSPSIRVFSNESGLRISWPKYWSFSILPSNEYSGLTGLISFLFEGLLQAPKFKCIDSLVLSLLYGSILTSINDYWKTIALTIWTFIGKVVSLLNMLSSFVIAFLSRSKHILISWLQSPSAVILEPKKIKSVTVPTFSLLFAMKWWD